jgi:hypothetical protein
MTADTSRAGWPKAAVLVGHLISAAIFIIAVNFKFYDIDGTVKYIIAEFPASKILAWLAAALGGVPDARGFFADCFTFRAFGAGRASGLFSKTPAGEALKGRTDWNGAAALRCR